MKNIKIRSLLILWIRLLSLFPLVITILMYDAFNGFDGVFTIIFSVILFLLGFCVAVLLDYHFAEYKCPKCGHIFKPKFNAYFFGVHTLKARHLKCPECGKKGWCDLK